MSLKKVLFSAALLAFSPAPAHAFSIKNLGDQPQTITIEQLGKKEEVTLQPGQHYIRRGVGIILHRTGKTPINAHPFGIYSVWPNGDIHIQRYEKVQLGNK